MRRGFSLLEVLLVIALLAMMGLITIPLYYRFRESDNLKLVFSLVVNDLNRAQIRSQSMENDSGWGVKFVSSTSQVVIFKGATYAGRDQTYDERSDVPTGITVNPFFEVVFNKLTGYPTATSSITVSNNFNESKNLNINNRGVIVY